MSNDNTLPEELQKDIAVKANSTLARASHDLKYSAGYFDGYIAGATEYAQKAKTIFDKILALEGQNYDAEITIGPDLINEIKSFLDGSK